MKSLKSQKTLYNSLFFYNLSKLSNFKKLEIKGNVFSFTKFLLNHPFLVELTNNSLVWVYLICINNSFVYLDVGKKITLIKPKLRKFFEISVYNELVLILCKNFFKSISIINLKNIIKHLFQYKSIKFKNTVSCGNGVFLLWSFCLKKLNNYNIYLEKFFIVELKKNFFSIFQKKINFFQFNILFKKYKS